MSRLAGRLVLRLLGWRVEGGPPPASKAVMIAAPHTSNWDFFYALLAGWTFGLTFQWLGKRELFTSPLGPLLRWLGGVPVDRSAAHGLVDQVTRRFRDEERLLLMVPAEGTRAWRPYWKSGFYRMALAADVPIVLGFLDYPNKRAGMGPALHPTGDVVADMDAIRRFYGGMEGKHPGRFSRIRLLAEDEVDGARGEAPPAGQG